MLHFRSVEVDLDVVHRTARGINLLNLPLLNHFSETRATLQPVRNATLSFLD